MKEQYIITEHNSWENETFNYIVYLKEAQFELIKEKINDPILGKNLSIRESNFTQHIIERKNKVSRNSYMSEYGFYKLEKKALKNWKEFGDCFYKGVGLKSINI